MHCLLRATWWEAGRKEGEKSVICPVNPLSYTVSYKRICFSSVFLFTLLPFNVNVNLVRIISSQIVVSVTQFGKYAFFRLYVKIGATLVSVCQQLASLA